MTRLWVGWAFRYTAGWVLTVMFPRGRRLQIHWTRPVPPLESEV